MTNDYNPEHKYGNEIRGSHLGIFTAELLIKDAVRSIPEEFIHFVRIKESTDGVGWFWVCGPLRRKTNVGPRADDWEYPED